MHKSWSILVAPVSCLRDAPAAFQAYVERYFVRQEIFGIPCMVAFRDTSFQNSSGNPRGVAPSHLVDLTGYKDGLEGTDLNAWIRSDAQRGLLWEFGASWNDGNLEDSFN